MKSVTNITCKLVKLYTDKDKSVESGPGSTTNRNLKYKDKPVRGNKLYNFVLLLKVMRNGLKTTSTKNNSYIYIYYSSRCCSLYSPRRETFVTTVNVQITFTRHIALLKHSLIIPRRMSDNERHIKNTPHNSRLPYKPSVKGTVSRDFLLQVFFMNHLPPSP
jgi:hypothetical protein